MRAGPDRLVLREGDGFRLICVPFAGGSARSFTRLVRYLDDSWHVTAVQPPADFSPGDAGLDELAAFYLELLAGELRGPGIVFGHSLGAAVVHRMAQLTAEHWPQDLHVVLSAPPAPRASCEDLLELDERALLVEATARGMLPEISFSEDFALRFLIPTLRSDLAVLGTRGWLPGPLDVPVHLLGGELDTVCSPEVWQRLRDDLRPCSVGMLEKAGHMYVVEEPARVAGAVHAIGQRVATPVAPTGI